jgi:hypothetical protein
MFRRVGFGVTAFVAVVVKQIRFLLFKEPSETITVRRAWPRIVLRKRTSNCIAIRYRRSDDRDDDELRRYNDEPSQHHY